MSSQLGVISGKGLSNSEAGPHALHVSPRDEAAGSYECRHVLCRMGRCSVAFTLGGQPVHGSPVTFRVIPARPAGGKSRLELATPKPAPRPTGGAAHTGMSAAQARGEAGGAAEGADGPVVPVPLVGQPFRLELHTRDAYGNRVDKGGASLDLDVEEPPIEAGSEMDHILAPKLESHIEDQLNGSYVITLTAAQPGDHVVTLRLGDTEVIGSPMPLTFTRPRILASTKAAGKSRGETLFVVASAIANAGLNWAFTSWLATSENHRDVFKWLHSIAAALVHADVRICFSTWLENAVQRAAVWKTIEGALRAIRRQFERKGFNAWLLFALERARKVALLRRTLNALVSLEMHMAFNTWFETLDLFATDVTHSTSFIVRRDKRAQLSQLSQEAQEEPSPPKPAQLSEAAEAKLLALEAEDGEEEDDFW